uniref:Uncharacterized protein n=1 Tax=Glossina pallidipes TaxID=7398 RepID=A0A1B0AI44_GLOPL
MVLLRSPPVINMVKRIGDIVCESDNDSVKMNEYEQSDEEEFDSVTLCSHNDDKSSNILPFVIVDNYGSRPPALLCNAVDVVALFGECDDAQPKRSALLTCR